MKRLSAAGPADFDLLQERLRRVPPATVVEEGAQALVDEVWRSFAPSLVLLRMFTTILYGDLPDSTRDFTDRRLEQTGNAGLAHPGMPVFTLMATRGRLLQWNSRENSAKYRCIPLASTAFVASLSMLSMHFAAMRFPLEHVDHWMEEVLTRGRADRYGGYLYIGDSASDRDEQGRPAVPARDFVAEHGVVTALGWGGGYSTHPALVTLFAFTDEHIEPHRAEPLGRVLEEYVRMTAEAAGRGAYFTADQRSRQK